jgi:hypothetical protein
MQTEYRRPTDFMSSSMERIPSEFAIGGVYFPPLLIASALGVLLALMTMKLLGHYRLTRFFYYPPMIFIAITIIYTGLIGIFVIPV